MWESIIIGLIFSIIVLYVFLRNFGITLVAAAAIPTTILITLVTMHVLHMSFNLMTLGGIAAAIGLVIDDAIVIVEAIYTKSHGGESPASAIRLALGGGRISTHWKYAHASRRLSPARVSGRHCGGFFRALAITMTAALLISLIVAVTLAPNLSALLLLRRPAAITDERRQGGPVLRRIIVAYEALVRRALRYSGITLAVCGLVIAGAVALYYRLDSDFLRLRTKAHLSWITSPDPAPALKKRTAWSGTSSKFCRIPPKSKGTRGARALVSRSPSRNPTPGTFL